MTEAAIPETHWPASDLRAHCALFAQGRCRSCSEIEQPYPEQLSVKAKRLQALFPTVEFPQLQHLPVAAGAFNAAGADGFGFRYKAKMAVGGTVDYPLLGVVPEQGEAVELGDCPLYPDGFSETFRQLRGFIKQVRLTPYNLSKRKGELKFIQLTRSFAFGEDMLRFVLRSEDKVDAIRAALPDLQAALPNLRVVSVNIQPVHMAVQEGEQEILLTASPRLRERLNDVPLFLAPGAFFQTHPAMASQLYATARAWCREADAHRIWDLFCGVGGFGLHCTPEQGALLGIEISAAAIDCAREAAALRNISAQFCAMDAAGAAAVSAGVPDVLIVNPPRRGIGTDVCQWIEAVRPAALLYSSCNAESMARDIQRLPSYTSQKLQLFDMFPHTPHYECLAWLQRRS